MIHELVEGEAAVEIQGTEVGTIQGGEFFWELGFLSDQPCNATVTATTTCVVQLISRADFEQLIQSRPHVMVELAKTLARRVTELDARLVAGQS